jgi:hypothetical protein
VVDEEEFSSLKKTRVEKQQPKNDKTLSLQSKPRPTGSVHKTFPPLKAHTSQTPHPSLNSYLNKNRMQIVPSPGRSLPPQFLPTVTSTPSSQNPSYPSLSSYFVTPPPLPSPNLTPVQSILFPLICSGSNVHALSPTGTGKTLSYVLPMLKHLDANVSSTSPSALIMGPTRELIIQINSVIKPLLKPNQKSLALYGGILR